MKRLALLLLLAAGAAHAQVQPAPEAPSAVDQQIVVIGEKLKTWKGSVAKADGRLVCRTREGTGDRKLDAIRCGAMLTCVRPLEGQIDELLASEIPQGAKRRAFDRLLVSAKPCMEKYEDAAVARLAAERARS
jgi:hypothetical protein